MTHAEIERAAPADEGAPKRAQSQLAQLQARLDGQGFEARIIGGRLFAVAPPEQEHDGSRLVDVLTPTSRPDNRGRIWYQGEPRLTEIITCSARPDDGGRLWFFDHHGAPIEEASHITDAAVRVGGALAGARAGR